ncbi:hypothetical protein ACTMTJ_13170 [Phytohabitans sp. LJ34]|uniref:hypothetical protein n=1 Tax=Phytohabitans sp. LJ34 TaxID=3452217 RepID=UPI003F891EF6
MAPSPYTLETAREILLGKSLFTKVCAARLSATDAFVTVRVPLRDVPDPSEAEMPIAGERAGALVVWLPELLRELDPGAVGEVGAVSIALAALIPDRDGRKVREWLPPDLRMEVADTPEGRGA